MKQIFKITKLIRDKLNLSDNDLEAVLQFKEIWNSIHKIQIIKTGKIVEKKEQFMKVEVIL